MTSRMCELLLSDSDSFATLNVVVIPLLSRISDWTRWHYDFRTKARELVEAHTERFLQVLYIVLPDNANKWPYGIGDALQMIEDTEESLRTDARFVVLRRKWNSK